MTSLHLKYAEFAGWPEALWVQGDRMELILVPQVGGRIMGLRWEAQDVFWVNAALAGKAVDVQSLQNPAVEKETLGFLLWGGNKTWLAPQEHWQRALPFVDLDSGTYDVEILENTTSQIKIALTSPICRESWMRITRILTMNTHCWSITHLLENRGDRAVRWGAWSNSMVRRPAQVFLPLGQSSAFTEGVKTFAHEGESLEVRSRVVSHNQDMAGVQCEIPVKFKFGVDSDRGIVLTVIPLATGGYLGWVSQFATDPAESYGHGCTAEVFNAAAHDYLEVEVHSPVRSLEPGKSFTFTENNRLVTLDAFPTRASDINALQLLGELC
ncbi:MAG: hypothetical protein F6K42_14295 [Leptolyngbya sp. SIO1D8]|nr:hypothetical protein [Leptolyngbya sp. SIO1D8]